MKKKYLFITFLLLLTFGSKAQVNYTVSSIPFVPYAATLPVQGTSDDAYSQQIALPFPFDFYGNTYSTIAVSTNGYIYFGTPTNNNSPWSFSTTIPNSNFPVKNAFFGCYHDLNNSDGQGTLTYGTYGTLPYRKFVIVFNNHSQFGCGAAAKSSFQMILNETTNNLEVQIVNKQVCNSWQNGNAVTGVVNYSGTIGITPPGRNTGSWTAIHEGWRFSRPNNQNYLFVKCDENLDGYEIFDLQVVQNYLLPSNPSSVNFYSTMINAQFGVNALPIEYLNTNNPEIIYAVSNGQIVPISLKLINCAVDYDNDTLPTALEDANNDTNLANDDTDGDGIPNYYDNDDDGDLVLTNQEYVITNKNTNLTSVLDTDNDGIPNYLDTDDDGDGVPTYSEDYDHDGNPANDDTNANGIPDYLENAVALGLIQNFSKNQILVYPNPTTDFLYIENLSDAIISNIALYAVNGALIKNLKSSTNLETIAVSDLETGMYFVKIIANDKVLNYKFMKK